MMERRVERDWTAPGDDDLVDAVVRLAAGGRAVLVSGEPGSGQRAIVWSAARRLSGPDGPLDICLAHVLRGTDTAGRVIVVTDITLVDDDAATTLARLVLDRSAIVIAATDGRSVSSPLTERVPFERVHVGGLHRAAAASYLENGLAGPVSECAARAVWETGEGSRARMRMVADDWVDLAVLARHRGVWVVCGSDLPAGPRLTREWEERFVKPDGTGAVYEALSLAGELPLRLLQEMCGREAVDAVYLSGHIAVSDRTERQVRLRAPAAYDLIAAHIPPGRAALLVERIVESGHARPSQRLAESQQRTGIGGSPLAETLTHLLQAGAFVEASRLLSQAPPGWGEAEMVRLGVVLAGRRPLGGRQLPSGERSVIEKLDGGDCGPVLKEQPVPQGLGWLWQQAADEALILSGRTEEGLRAGRELLDLMEGSDFSPALLERARRGQVDLEILAGEWSRAAALLARSWSSEGDLLAWVVDRALFHVLSGSFHESAALLRKEVPQIEVADRRDLYPLATSLLALSHAALGDVADARRALADIGHGWGPTFFAAQALALIGQETEAVGLLVGVADRDRSLGSHGRELLALSQAVQWGDDTVLERLADAAGRTDSRFAKACSRAVRGMMERSVPLIEEGAIMARAIGQHRFADFAQRRADDMSAPTGRPLPESGGAELTRRQREIVDRVLAGQSNAAIADAIGISVRTVESHLYTVYIKLNVSHRADLIALFSHKRSAPRKRARPT